MTVDHYLFLPAFYWGLLENGSKQVMSWIAPTGVRSWEMIQLVGHKSNYVHQDQHNPTLVVSCLPRPCSATQKEQNRLPSDQPMTAEDRPSDRPSDPPPIDARQRSAELLDLRAGQRSRCRGRLWPQRVFLVRRRSGEGRGSGRGGTRGSAR